MSVHVAFRVVREWDVVQVELTAEGESRVNRLTAEGKCLDCEVAFEPGDKVVCGCHAACYASQYYSIRKGKTTVTVLIQSGYRLPNGTPGRKPRTEQQAKRLGRKVSKKKGA